MQLIKIISGGQTGADQAGLKVAKVYNIKTGGFAPHDFTTKDGPNRTLLQSRYGLVESTGGYKQRTGENVKASDGTIRLAISFITPGEKCTFNAIKKYNKPYIDVSLLDPIPASKVVNWILRNRIEVLNVAGNTQNTLGYNTFKLTYEYLKEVIEILKDK